MGTWNVIKWLNISVKKVGKRLDPQYLERTQYIKYIFPIFHFIYIYNLLINLMHSTRFFSNFKLDKFLKSQEIFL